MAAWLAGGGDPERLGPRLEDPVRLPWPDARRTADGLEGECLAADTFGNLITSIRRVDLAGGDPLEIAIGARPARLVATYGEASPGELVALWGSAGRLEFAVREGSAARATGLGPGAPVRLRLRRR